MPNRTKIIVASALFLLSATAGGACTQDFEKFDGQQAFPATAADVSDDASNNNASSTSADASRSDASADATVVGDGSTCRGNQAPTSCLTTRETCRNTCDTTYNTCEDACTNNTCRSRCRADQSACRNTCNNTCKSCSGPTCTRGCD